ncbi:butanol dehydrogenase [Actinobacillus delphinicola]|uniref:Bifunctional acetaldehyde-CoA/alcohol dehydrogenase n=1 Tax=Actinobacillus delphinicola TaxID=51161 RepID=A0A448TTI5_9PAST|nr:iron-containing alcohol dehydrogenase [Actinobacillus delphinicola]MDG6897476.1 butanol dehydrogenase [Actinobacillus delphinicola]VEJ09299.1 bifunctional acetaldehyde-CoA/alcohol dehydrogenase [Actinobacillus delphinicola]
MNRFTIPRDVYFGDNAVEYLAQVDAKRAFIVYDGTRLEEDGTIARLQDYLRQAGVESTTFNEVDHDPSVEMVRNGLAKMNEFKPDLIVGVGGGSPIDAAKAMWIFYEHPELSFEEAAKPFSLPKLRNKAHFIAITTTSGTATEVTSFSVITDEKTGIKYPIADFNITPDVAIVDTTLVETLPKGLVANTGMDALTHAIEAYTSNVATPFTDALAIKAIEMIMENLVASYRGDMEARKAMHIAQNLAGMAFSNAILGIVHSMAHKSGKVFDIPHGMINSICLPHATRFNAKTAPEKYVDIAKRLHLEGETDQALIDALVAAIRNLQVNMNMAASFKDYGLSEELFLNKVDEIAAAAVLDPCTSTNPREINNAEMTALFKAAYYNTEVDF